MMIIYLAAVIAFFAGAYNGVHGINFWSFVGILFFPCFLCIAIGYGSGLKDNKKK